MKQGATLDYETKDSYTGAVEYTVQGQSASVSLTINVSDVGTGKPDTPTVTRTAFSEPSNPALDVTWQAVVVDGATVTGYKAQYRKKIAAGEKPAAWTAYTGTLSAATTSLNLSDLEAGATYEAQVRAVTSEEGEGPWSDIAEGTANLPPTAEMIPEQTGAANSLGSLSADNYFNDPDSDSLIYEVSTDQPSLIEVDDGRIDTVTWRYLGHRSVADHRHRARRLRRRRQQDLRSDGHAGDCVSAALPYAAVAFSGAAVASFDTAVPGANIHQPVSVAVFPERERRRDRGNSHGHLRTVRNIDPARNGQTHPSGHGIEPGGLHGLFGRRGDPGGKPQWFRHPHPDPG